MIFRVSTLFLFLIALLYTFIKKPIAAFEGHIQTEFAEFEYVERDPFSLFLENVLLIQDNQEELFTGRVTIYANSIIKLNRLGKGAFKINIINDTVDGIIINDKQSNFLKAPKELNVIVNTPQTLFENGLPLVISFSGKLKLDVTTPKNTGIIKNSLNTNDPPFPSPMLKSGNVKINTKSLLTKDFYSIGPFPLGTGDTIEFDPKDTVSYGFFTVTEEPGIKLVFVNEAKKMRVKKYRAERYEPIAANVWQIIANDKILTLLWSVLLFMITFLRKN